MTGRVARLVVAASVVLPTAIAAGTIEGTVESPVTAPFIFDQSMFEPIFPFQSGWNSLFGASAGSVDTPVLPGRTGDNEIPNRMFLDQNYPNPFNPSTMIRYGVPSETMVRLTVHTLLGNEIKVLVDERQEAGTYMFDFAALDLPSGAYFYRLQTPLGTLTRRMTISK